MPFRRFYQRAGIRHPAAYSNATFALGVLVCMAIAVWISVSASNNATTDALERERMAQENSRRAVCIVVDSMNDVYSAPTTPTGVAAQKAWRSLGVQFRCNGSERPR